MMNFSICKKFISPLLLSAFIISHIQIKNNDSPVSILDNITDQVLKQLESTQISISEISAMINDDQVPSVIDKKKTLQGIRQISHLIQEILQEKFLAVSPDTTLFLIHYNRAIMLHILDATSKNFRNLSEFNPNKYPFLRDTITRSVQKKPTNISLKQLNQELALNEKLLREFSQKADRIGLEWWNILYRTFDKHLIDPCQHYQIPTRTLKLLSAVSCYIYFAWHFDNDLPKWMQLSSEFKKRKLFQKWLGKKPFQPTLTNGSVEIPDTEGFVNRLDRIVALIRKDLLPVGGLLSLYCSSIFQSEWKNLKPFLNEKLSILTNKLKGGSYLKKAHRLQGIIEEVYFDDLVGLNHVKVFYNNLIAYLENPEPFDRLGISPPKGCLLIGDTRTGKSYSVQALFTELNKMLERDNRKDEFKFFELSSSDINSEGIGYLLSIIKSCAPCIVFIDEIDLLDLQRRGKNSMLSEFLTCMSGALSGGDSKNQVIIIAATNRPENLDEALRTPGRFGKELRFEYPSLKDRKEFIAKQLNKFSLNLTLFDIDKLTRETEGKAYEALKLLINQSVLKARIRGEMLTQKHLEETLNETIRNVIEENFKDIPQHEKELLSIHFSGHALALMLLNMHIKLASVTIKPVMMHIREEFMGAHLWQDENNTKDKQKHIEYGEIFTHQNHDTINVMRKEEKLSLCKYYLAGIAAEEIIFGSCSFSCHTQDKEKALTLIKSLVFEGIDVNRLPNDTKNQLYDEVFSLLNVCKQETVSLLTPHKETLLTIAQALQKCNTLSQKDVLHIIEPPVLDTTKETISEVKDDTDISVLDTTKEAVSEVGDDTDIIDNDQENPTSTNDTLEK